MSIELKVISVDLTSTEGVQIVNFDKERVTIGRSTDNDLVLDRFEVSAHHACIHFERQKDGAIKLFVTDLSSANGVSVENEPIEANKPVALVDGDRVLLGTYLIKARYLGVEKTEEEPAIDSRATRELSHLRSVFQSRSKNAATAPVAKEEDEVECFDQIVASGNGHEAKPYCDDEPMFAAAASGAETDLQKSLERSIGTCGANDDCAGMFDTLHSSRNNDDVIHLGPGPDAPYELEDTKDKGEIVSARATVELSSLGIVEDRLKNSPQMEIARNEKRERRHTKLGMRAGKMGGGDIIDFDFSAIGLYAVKGRVMNRGKALAGVEVDGGALGKQTTKADGTFCFTEVREGLQYQFTLKKEGFQFEDALPSGSISSDCDFSFMATKLNTISGRVLHRNQPLIGVEIDGGPLGKTKTDNDGRYFFYDVPEDLEFTLTASKQGFAFATNEANAKEEARCAEGLPEAAVA